MSVNRVAGFHHAALTVSDLERSRGWYEQVFDLDLQFEEHEEHRRAAIYRFAGTDGMLGLVEHRGGEVDAFRPERIGLDHLAFTVLTRDAIEDWAVQLGSLGVEHSGVIDIPPGGILNFRDPDGIQLAVFWDRDS